MENLSKLKQAVRGKKFLLLGPTGSGKGNRSRDLKSLGLIHIGLGMILREKVRNDPDCELSRKVVETTRKGTLLPDEVVFPIIREYINRPECRKRGFVLEGFPRTRKQAEWLLAQFEPDMVLLLDVPGQFLIDGILKYNRQSCVKCAATYSDFDPPTVEGVCDRCGGKLIRRMSDSISRVKKRLQIYRKEIKTFLPLFQERGLVQVLPITVNNEDKVDENDLKKLKGEIFRVTTDDGGKARMLNYEGMRKRLYKILWERFCEI